MDVYERIGALSAGETVFVDLHYTLMQSRKHNGRVNLPLIKALKETQKRGVLIVLWTGGNWAETAYGVELMARHGLHFDDILMNQLKGTIIVDDRALNPNT